MIASYNDNQYLQPMLFLWLQWKGTKSSDQFFEKSSHAGFMENQLLTHLMTRIHYLFLFLTDLFIERNPLYEVGNWVENYGAEIFKPRGALKWPGVGICILFSSRLRNTPLVTLIRRCRFVLTSPLSIGDFKSVSSEIVLLCFWDKIRGYQWPIVKNFVLKLRSMFLF